MIRTIDPAAAIPVLEHALWCAEQGMTPADIFRALQKPAHVWPTWARAVQALIVEHNAIKKRQTQSLLREAA